MDNRVELSNFAFLVKSIENNPERKEEFIEMARKYGMSEDVIKATEKYFLDKIDKL